MSTGFSRLIWISCFTVAIKACQPPDENGLTDVHESSQLNNLIDWGIYRGDKKATQYSELAQIQAANVHHLTEAWVYHTGDATDRSSMQCNPIVVNGRLYLSTFSLNAIALDAATGDEVWVFKSAPHNENQADLKGRNRGVVYWEGAQSKRIFHFVRHRIYALDAETGQLIPSFGESGHIDLRENLGIDPSWASSVEVTTPGAIYRDLLIVTSRVDEGYQSAPGHVRAYNALTGEFEWIFHTIPKEGEYGFDTWEWVPGERYGGANAWGGLTVDEERGWVFCATGSPAPDFYGGYRKGTNLFGNCVLALNAQTGERIWHFQTVHHDLWDYDNPSAPILVTVQKDGDRRDAVVQLTKMGFIFVLDRETGQPLFPVDEMPVPPSTVPGEEAWPTQPIPRKPPSLSRQQVTAASLSRVTPESHKYALMVFSKYHSGPLYTPPSTLGEITTPGHQGGIEWHGGSFDRSSNTLFVNSHDGPTINRLVQIYNLDEMQGLSTIEKGSLLYQNLCVSCHGPGREGVPPVYPSLVDLNHTDSSFTVTLENGKGLMPSFSELDEEGLKALYAFLVEDTTIDHSSLLSAGSSPRYTMESYQMMKDQYGAPAISPPWGLLNAIDLSRGDIIWQVPLGEYPSLAAKGFRNTGSMNFGGCVATSGGVVFIAATYDEKIRAFEKVTGRMLWEQKLPAGGYATPSIYEINGKQFVTIVAGGGGKNGTPSSDAVVAFTLPDHVIEYAIEPGDATASDWVDLFDGRTLEGWVHLNGSHIYTVEDSAIVGTTVEGSQNSFLCTKREFADFELEVEVVVDSVTNSGIQFRSQVRPYTVGEGHQFAAGRVYGPQAEIRRYQGQGVPTTGMFYGEALGTGWLSTKERIDTGHRHYLDEAWNHLRIRAVGPRMQTWVNGHLIDDIVREDVYETHPKGFIGLQIHGINGQGPFVMKWRKIRIRSL